MNVKRSKRILFEIFMLIITFILFYPVLMIIFMSFKGDQEIILAPLSLPKTWVFDNYKEAFERMDYIRVVLNSLWITLTSTVIGTMLYCMGAYSIVRAKKHKKFFKVIYILFIAGLMLPAQSTLIPLIYFYKQVHLMGTYTGIMLLFVAGAAGFSIFLVSGFINTVPIELEEAAHIDGCTPYGVFFRIMLPLLKPVICTLVIVNAINIWNDFYTPLMFMPGKASRTITLAVYMFRGQFQTQWNILFAALVLATIPMMIIYFSLQKYIISGMTAGSGK